MKRILAILAVAVPLVMTASCEKYEDGRPIKTVRDNFKEMYPGAWDVEWEREMDLWEVNFETGARPHGTEHTAWFDLSGNWKGTKTELSYASVPSEIINHLMSSDKLGDKQWVEKSVDFYETPEGSFYRFDVMLNGLEVKVDVTEDGKVSLAGMDY